ncbi:TetR/AcrR family transcriptional regulator [Rhodococcoides fascians]|uniref:TetR/AcrR family transcriptional regulator n=1 Tax=Rhodococcoides fascians TaxID=1828 RepID=UPI00050C1431|nr:TetR/AcrR family transcriptional regulator [Rhodococcus fascians]
MVSTRVGGAQNRRKVSATSTRRTELLAIAARMFAQRGYSQTTVRDIADEAGILSGSLYHHFDSKEAMLTEILRQFMDDLRSQFALTVQESASAPEALEGLIRNTFARIHEWPYAVALYQNESGLFMTASEFEFVADASVEIAKLWRGVLDSGRESGDFRPDLDTELVYRFIRDAVWSTVRWYQPGGRLGHDEIADQYISMLRGGLMVDRP